MTRWLALRRARTSQRPSEQVRLLLGGRKSGEERNDLIVLGDAVTEQRVLGRTAVRSYDREIAVVRCDRFVFVQSSHRHSWSMDSRFSSCANVLQDDVTVVRLRAALSSDSTQSCRAVSIDPRRVRSAAATSLRE